MLRRLDGLWHWGVPLLVACIIASLGCSASEDKRFRNEVGPVLKLCAELNSDLGVAAWTPEELVSEQARTNAEIERYGAAVRALPQPRDKRLRYLAIRLGAFRVTAAEMVGARIATLDALINARLPGLTPGAKRLTGYWLERRGREQRESEAKYGTALRYVLAAEQVALGTSGLRDALEASYLGGHEPPGVSRAQRDSLVAQTEGLVRSEIAAMR